MRAHDQQQPSYPTPPTYSSQGTIATPYTRDYNHHAINSPYEKPKIIIDGFMLESARKVDGVHDYNNNNNNNNNTNERNDNDNIPLDPYPFDLKDMEFVPSSLQPQINHLDSTLLSSTTTTTTTTTTTHSYYVSQEEWATFRLDVLLKQEDCNSKENIFYYFLYGWMILFFLVGFLFYPARHCERYNNCYTLVDPNKFFHGYWRDWFIYVLGVLGVVGLLILNFVASNSESRLTKFCQNTRLGIAYVHNHKNENETTNTMMNSGASSVVIHPIQVELRRHIYAPKRRSMPKQQIWIELYYNPDSTPTTKRTIARPTTTMATGASAINFLNDPIIDDGFYPESHLFDYPTTDYDP